MTLAEKLQPRLDAWAPTGAGRHTWSTAIPEDGWSVHLAADRNDSLSTLVWEVNLTRSADAPAGLTLRAYAEGIAKRVSGLREDLKVLEVDEISNEALLRSDDPTRKGDVAGYFELRLFGVNRALLRRYQANLAAHTSREQVAFAVTHEVLAEVAAEIAG